MGLNEAWLQSKKTQNIMLAMQEKGLEACLATIERLLKFLEEHQDITDRSADDGCGAVDTWRSDEFEDVLAKAELALIVLRKQVKTETEADA
jgi:hypothetical protein